MKLLLFRSLFLPAAALCSSFAGAAFASPPSVKPPVRPKLTTPALYALGPPAAFAIVTDKDNGGSVTLPPDTTLIVLLRSTPQTQSAWNLLLPPNLPLRLTSLPRHQSDSDEFAFAPHYLPGRTQTFTLRFVLVDPRQPTLSAVRTWQTKVVVPPAFVEGHTLPPTISPSH